MGMVVKSNIGELEDEVREGFSMWLRKELTDVGQGVSSKDLVHTKITPTLSFSGKYQKPFIYHRNRTNYQ